MIDVETEFSLIYIIMDVGFDYNSLFFLTQRLNGTSFGSWSGSHVSGYVHSKHSISLPTKFV